MKKRLKILVYSVAFLFILGFLLSSLAIAYSGGWQDDNQDYNCGGTSCHSGDANQGAGEVEVTIDKTSVLSGQSLSLTVNVTLVQLGGDSMIGVFLLSGQTGSDDLPTEFGWKIAQDPNGGTAGDAKNYVEIQSPGSGEEVPFKWILEAPPTPGTYNLYVRVHHGSVARNPLWEDYSGTISIEVNPLPVGLPQISHNAVSTGYVEELTLLQASVVNASKVFLHWRASGESQFNSIEMTNSSTESEFGWIFEGSIPAQGTEGKIEYQIIANRETGNGPLVSDTSVFTMSIVKRPELPNMTAWIAQIIIATEAVVFAGIIGIRMVKSKTETEEDTDV